MEIENIKKNREYKVSFILKEEDASVVHRVLGNFDIKIISETPLVKVRLAYPIKKENFGFAGFLGISTTDEALIPKTLAALKHEPQVLRAIGTLRSPFESEEKKQIAENTARSRGRRPRREAGTRPAGFRSELSNEALEKKIEEILQ